MKKLLTSFLAVTFIVAVSSSVFANGTPIPEVIEEGVEISGAVDVVGGWQHDDQDATATGGSIGGLADYDGGITVGNTANADHFRMIINQVEIDLQKSFGENIRLRADLDFVDPLDTNQSKRGIGDVVSLEQAYITANLAAGNGIEFLFGKFNAPVGVESVDSRENWLISYSSTYRYVTPHNLTGAKLYYAFSDLVDLHFAVVNDLNANGFGDSSLPSALFRLGFNWGDEGRENTVGISGGFGPESDSAVIGGASNKKHYDFFGDMDLLIALSDAVTLGVEGIYRQSNALVTGANQKVIAGFAALNYQASDVWDITFRADYLWEINPCNARGSSGASTTGSCWTDLYGLNAATGAAFEGTLVTGSVGLGYMITDNAKMKLEYRFDWAKAGKAVPNSDAQALVGQFAYTF